MPSTITINVFLRIALDGGLEPLNESIFYNKLSDSSGNIYALQIRFWGFGFINRSKYVDN